MAAGKRRVKKAMKLCRICDEVKPTNKDGHGGLRRMCEDCETRSRKNHKRRVLKDTKRRVTRNGGSASSRQKIKP